MYKLLTKFYTHVLAPSQTYILTTHKPLILFIVFFVKGLYRGDKDNEMRLGICSRSNDIVEPLIKPQWYVNCASMAKDALNAVLDTENRKIEILPKQYEAEWKRYFYLLIPVRYLI